VLGVNHKTLTAVSRMATLCNWVHREPFTKSYTIAVAIFSLTSLLSITANAVTIFTDRAAWNLEVKNFTNETFSTARVMSDFIVFDTGISSESIGGLSANFVNNAQEFNGAVNNRSIPNVSTFLEWRFPAAISAFGSDLRSVDLGGLNITGDYDGTGDQTISVAEILSGGSTAPCVSCLDGFFGVVGNSSFTSIRWFTDNSEEIFQMDNFSFSIIPEPTTLAIFAFGVAGLGVVRRRTISTRRSLQ
jgi:PEP-CTERM motif